MQLSYKDLPHEGIPAVIPINASGLKISACPRRWFLTVFLGLNPKTPKPQNPMHVILNKNKYYINYMGCCQTSSSISTLDGSRGSHSGGSHLDNHRMGKIHSENYALSNSV